MQSAAWERIEKRLWRLRANQNWLRVKALFLPNVAILSMQRSGFQWFRQICRANLYRHVVMPPGARYQHFNVERIPARHKLDRNGILLVRDGRDVVVSLYMSATRDGPNGTRLLRERDEVLTFADYLRADARAVLDPEERVLLRLNPAAYWAKFNEDWLAHPHVVAVVRYEDVLADQVAVIRHVWRALGYDEHARRPVEIHLDFDRHGPRGRNVLPGYERRTEGNWRRIFTSDDAAFFDAQAGRTLARLRYASGAAATIPADEAERGAR